MQTDSDREESELSCCCETTDMSACEFESLEKCLESHLPEAELTEVKRILFGKETKWVSVVNQAYKV